MKVLVTGAAGYLGRGLIVPFADHGHELRLMDVREFDSPHEVVAGTVEDLDQVRDMVAGVDAVVIAHMAPRSPDSYAEPPVCFDINVKGTANLLFAAAEAGIKRIAVISSFAAIAANDQPWTHDMRPRSKGGLYGMTKAAQELIAEQFQRDHQMGVCAIRVGYIMDADSMHDKYGREVSEWSPAIGDRRDIGDVARLWLERDEIAYRVFHMVGTERGPIDFDMDDTCSYLNWKPAYDFSWLPKPASKS